MDKRKIKAQVSLEFALTFILLMLFILLTTRVFVWLGRSIVLRHQAYENSRTMFPNQICGGPGGTCTMNESLRVNFYNEKVNKMDLFNNTQYQ